MPGDYTHGFFIEHFKAQGHVLTLPGLCAGFAEAARIFFLVDAVNYVHFMKIVDYIANIEPDQLAIEINAVKLSFQKQQSSSVAVLPVDARRVREAELLFEVISAFSQPKVHEQQLGSTVSQPKVMQVTNYVESKLFSAYQKKLGGTSKVGSFPTIFDNKDEVSRHYLEFLKEIAKSATLEPAYRISFCLDSMSHRVHIGFDGEKNRWYLGDINHITMLNKPLGDEVLGSFIIQAMSKKAGAGPIAFDTAIYTSSNNYERCKVVTQKCVQLHQLVFSLESAVFVRLSDDKKSIKSKKSYDGATYAHLAAKFGYPALMKQIKAMHTPAMSEMVDHLTPLSIAKSHHQSDVVDVLLDDKKEVITPCKNDSNEVKIYAAAMVLAIKNDHQEVFKSLLKVNAKINDTVWQSLYEHYQKNKKYPAILHDVLVSQVAPGILTNVALKFIYLAIALGDFEGFSRIFELSHFKEETLHLILNNVLTQYKNSYHFGIAQETLMKARFKIIEFLLDHGVDASVKNLKDNQILKSI